MSDIPQSPDDQTSSESLYLEFENLCRDMFVADGFLIQSQGGRGPGVDLLLRNEESGGLGVADVKLYRSAPVPFSLLRNSLNQVDSYRQQHNADEAFLVVSVLIDPQQIVEVKKTRDIDIWDLQKLSEVARGNLRLSHRLDDFLRRASVSTASGFRPSNARGFESADEDPPSPIGEKLIAELISIPPGRDAAKRFEKWCVNCLKYLFSEEFAVWSAQSRVERGFHIMDLIGRLAPSHLFWSGVSADFRTRYIVFEFKNYTEDIGQDQIYSTEKYLYTTALRSVAVIIARAGIDDGARHAIKGALRESGKLILWVSLAELLNMLRDKDVGNDPHNLLFDRLDELLTDIGR